MKKILWFSNCILSDANNKASGSWLYSMSRLLVSTEDIHLVNITRRSSGRAEDDVKHTSINERFEEYVLPNWKLENKGWPSSDNCREIVRLVEIVKPDLVHVWGVENYFCTLLPTFKLSIPLLLEIQGLHGTCADVYYGDMSIRDTFRCLGLREILFPFKKSIYILKASMRHLGEVDEMAIKQYRHISVQSRWIEDRIAAINSTCNLYNTGMSLRKEFWNAERWQYNETLPKCFYCSAAGPSPYKSLQTAVKALAVVVKRYPDTKLYVIGNFKDSNWVHQPGYLTFFKKTIKQLGLEQNIVFTGSLTASGIVEIMHQCIGMVQTSYVESYSLAVAEAQAVGVPSIVSYAGAMPELAVDREEALFFSPGDYVSCAARMIELIENKDLANHLSDNSFNLVRERNGDDVVLATQLRIYNEIWER